MFRNSESFEKIRSSRSEERPDSYRERDKVRQRRIQAERKFKYDPVSLKGDIIYASTGS